MRTVAIIQSRMGSTRLPGKVLKEICGKPILEHIVERLQRVPSLDDIVLATTTNEKDDQLAEFSLKLGICCFRGSEDDVLSRYLKAAEMSQAELIIRITGDCPLIDPPTIDTMIQLAKKEKAEYVICNPSEPVIHEGFEVVSIEALRKVDQLASEDYHREHVTIYIKENSNLFNIKYADTDPEYKGEGYRISVDNNCDFRFMQEVYKRLYIPGEILDLKRVIALLKDHPEIRELNRHISQKSVRAASYRVVFLIEGGSQSGLGHLRRCLSLAKVLHESYHCGIEFITNNDPKVTERIVKRGFSVRAILDSEDIVKCLGDLYSNDLINVLVVDTKNYYGEGLIQRLRREFPNLLIAVIDKVDGECEMANLVVIPAAHVPYNQEPTFKKAKLLIGPQYIILGEEFSKEHRIGRLRQKDKNNLIVSMGGSDPNNITLKVLRALEASRDRYNITVIIGPAYVHKDELFSFTNNCKRKIEVVENPSDIVRYFKTAAVAIVAFGVTVYEMAALGVPAVVITHTPKDIIYAEQLEKTGLCLNLGYHNDISVEGLASKLETILSQTESFQQIEKKNASIVDGGGALRVSEEIYKLIQSYNLST